MTAELTEERRRLILQQTCEDYRRLRQDPKAWADWQRELRIWEATLLDGLPNDD